MQAVIVGHRGAAGLAPENTLESFRTAYDLGVRLLELDVRLTRDGAVVCFHDDRLDRVTDGQGPVADHDWDTLAALRVMSGAFRGAYPGARIPLLEQVLTDLPSDTAFAIELKAEPVRPDELVQRTLEIVRRAGAQQRVRYISFEASLLSLVRKYTPQDPTPNTQHPALGFIVGRSAREALFPTGTAVGAAVLHPNLGMVDVELVRRAHEEGFLVNAWTVNTPEEVRRLADLGVDEITSDYPDMALRSL
jgi:glycerophosphoryl diester phosphodiesterase